MKRLSLAIVLLASIGRADTAPELKWFDHGQAKETIGLAALRERSEPLEFTVWEPHEGREATYRGFSLRDLLEKIYGPSWKKADEIVISSANAAPLAVEMARLKAADAFLVFEKIGSEAFTVTNRSKGDEVTKLGPFYLAWDNLKSRDIRNRGTEGWLTGVTSLDLLLYSDKHPRSAPPADEKPSVKEGFVAFRAFCITCHTVNGEGGKGGPELNYPASVTEYLTPIWLSKWMLEPASVRFNTTMPALDAEMKNRKLVAKDITSYLKAMAGAKQKPDVATAPASP